MGPQSRKLQFNDISLYKSLGIEFYEALFLHFLRIEGDEYIISLTPPPPTPSPRTIVVILKFEIFKPETIVVV